MRAYLRALAALALATGSAALAPAPGSAQVQVSIRRLAPVEAIFLADLLPGSAGLRPDLLGITLVSQDASRPVILEVAVAREDPSPLELFRGTTDPFVPREPVRHLTSRDLASNESEFAITDYTVNEDVLDDASLRTGRLPSGTYLFTVTVRSQQGAVLDSDELRITLGSASRVDLLSPGVPADAGPPSLVPGPTPRFLWSSIGESSGRYRLRVVRVDGEGSAVEAVQGGFPVWETVTSATSALYPASAQALRLEPGGTYAWQVTRELGTTGGDELVESPIYWFRIDGTGAAGDAADPGFAILLRSLGLSPELDGFTPVGARLQDGRVISLQELEALLAAIAAGEIPVLSVRVQ